ncbi:hypothetical protein [Nocardia xishanensis]
MCLQLNAEIGDCFTDPQGGRELSALRKIPCTRPGAFQVKTKVAGRDLDVRNSAIRRQHPDVVAVAHSDKSYCLNPIRG